MRRKNELTNELKISAIGASVAKSYLGEIAKWPPKSS